jgi:PmbA protein
MPGIVGQDRFEEVAAAALELGGVDGVEILLIHEWGGLTRFANSEIHQSTAGEDTGIRVRVVRGGRVGVAASNDFSPKGARRAATSAKEMAEVSAPDPLWPGLTPPKAFPDVPGFDDATANCTPEQRAESVASLVATCPGGFVAAGAYETRAAEVAIANSEGQVCWAPWTQANLTAVIAGGDGGSGFAETFTATTEGVDAEAIGVTAADKAVRSQTPAPLDPGRYPVVLEPAATATLVGFLAWIGFAGRLYAEGRSCFSGKAERQLMHPDVTIYDDATDPRTIGVGFDFEGEPKRRVDLVKHGVFIDAVYDRRTAKEASRSDGSTGHGLPPPNPEGPFPLHLFMDTGRATVNEMVAATERGLLVTRFHYSNVVNPMESSITGMTRDGTFLIERGEIIGPVRNLRFTQSIIDALSGVTMVGRESSLASEFFFSASRVPALRLEEFHFTGVSDH